ncbi:hypothetical protein [Levilactobacillus sp. HBUAS70063]|uniref:hypothetical protein n=1 Tax=Levilactobacillus sp. HBUAS70063 TaxID=3109359 RepID=UPI003132E13F
MYEKAQSNGVPLRFIISILATVTAFLFSAVSGMFIVAWLTALFAGYYISKLRKQQELILYSIILILVLQNLIIGIGAHVSGNTNGLTFLTQVPLIFTLGVFFGEGILNIEFDSVTVPFVLLLLVAVGSMAFGHGSAGSILANIRNLSFFYIVYEISSKVTSSERFSAVKFCRHLLRLAVIIIVIGIVLLIGGYSLYNWIGINEVYNAKSASALQMNGALDGRFYTDVFGVHVTRMGSLYYEPVNLGYLLVGILIFLLMFQWTKNKLESLLMESFVFIGVILTFGKGALLALFLILLAPTIHKVVKKVLFFFSDFSIYTCMIVLVSLFVYLYSNFYYMVYGGAVGNHFTAISETWVNIIAQPLGHGLGTGGNAAATLNSGLEESSWLSTGGETAFLSFGYQIGLIGIVLLAVTFFNVGKKSIISSSFLKKSERSNLIRLAYVPVVLIIISIFQDNTYAPQCIAIYMMLVSMRNYIIKTE